MTTYSVIVHETTELTYSVEADSPAEAFVIVQARDGRRGSPDESCIDSEIVCVIADTEAIEPGKLNQDAIIALIASGKYGDND